VERARRHCKANRHFQFNSETRRTARTIARLWRSIDRIVSAHLARNPGRRQLIQAEGSSVRLVLHSRLEYLWHNLLRHRLPGHPSSLTKADTAAHFLYPAAFTSRPAGCNRQPLGVSKSCGLFLRIWFAHGPHRVEPAVGQPVRNGPPPLPLPLTRTGQIVVRIGITEAPAPPPLLIGDRRLRHRCISSHIAQRRRKQARSRGPPPWLADRAARPALFPHVVVNCSEVDQRRAHAVAIAENHMINLDSPHGRGRVFFQLDGSQK